MTHGAPPPDATASLAPPAGRADSPGVLVFPPALFGGAMLAGLLLHCWQRKHLLPAWPARGLGAVLVAAGFALANWGKRRMVRAGTNVMPSQPTTAIVTDGPFRYTRNPLYVATVLVYVGVALLVNGLWPLLMVVPAIVILQWGVIAREERYLAAKFGQPYLDYKKRVRPWL